MSETVCKLCGRPRSLHFKEIWCFENEWSTAQFTYLAEPAEPAPGAPIYIAEATPVEPGTPTCQVCGALATKSASGWVCKAHWTPPSPAPQSPAAVGEDAKITLSIAAIREFIDEIAALKARAEAAEARLAILDAQEVGLPNMDVQNDDVLGALAYIRSIPEDDENAKVRVRLQNMYSQVKARERQLLDALRAVKAWRDVAGQMREAFAAWIEGTEHENDYEKFHAAIAAYDSLAGNNG